MRCVGAAVIPCKIVILFHPLQLTLLFMVRGIGKGGAEHGGETDGTRVEPSQDEGMSGGLKESE